MRLSTCVASMAIASLFAVPAATSTTAAATPQCGTDSLKFSSSGPISPGQQPYVHFYVILTNISQQTCTLQGYPGVDLVGPDDPMLGTTYSMPRRTNDAMPLTPLVLAPGVSAASLVGFLPPRGPDYGMGGWLPTTIVVTPPDATTQLQMPWSEAAVTLTVLRQGDERGEAGRVYPLQPYS